MLKSRIAMRDLGRPRRGHPDYVEIGLVTHLPFPIRGIDSDNCSEFINDQLYRRCRNDNLKFARYRSGNKNYSAHVEQKN
jgi:hypothetical protein